MAVWSLNRSLPPFASNHSQVLHRKWRLFIMMVQSIALALLKPSCHLEPVYWIVLAVYTIKYANECRWRLCLVFRVYNNFMLYRYDLNIVYLSKLRSCIIYDFLMVWKTSGTHFLLNNRMAAASRVHMHIYISNLYNCHPINKPLNLMCRICDLLTAWMLCTLHRQTDKSFCNRYICRTKV